MRIKDLFRLNPGRFVALLAARALTALLTTWAAFALTWEFSAIKGRHLQQFLLFTGLQLLLLLLGSLLDQAADYFWELHLEKYFHQIRQEVLAHAYAEPAGTKENLQSELTNDLEMLKEQYADSIGSIVHSAVLLGLVGCSLAAFRWSLLLLLLVVSVLQMYLPRVLDGPLQRATDRISASNRRYLQTLADWLSGLDTLRRYAVGEEFLKIVHVDARELETAYVKEQKADQELDYLNQAIYSLGNMLIFLLTAYLVARGQLEFGLIASVNDFSLYLFGSLMNIANYRGQLVASRGLREKILALRAPLVRQEQPGEAPAAFATKDLRLTFANGYEIKYPDIKIKPGEKVLLTGANGSGKSTLFKLLMGEVVASSGQINFFDQDGKKITPDRSKIGYLPQQAILLPASVMNNITMFDPALASAAKASAADVQLTEAASGWPQGLETPVDLAGDNLSGGQKQKVVLARAEVHSSQLLLIDEGTSAIDQAASQAILHELLKSKRTVVLIAHNLPAKERALFDRELALTA